MSEPDDNQISYSQEEHPASYEVAEVLRRSGIRRPHDDLERIERMIAGADLIVTARTDSRLVGIARSITDYSYCCYLSDLAVDAAYQRRGIGRRLVEEIRLHLGDEVMILLLAAPEAADYYGPLGFRHIDNGWMLPRES
jgi:GNAT superfamily N-acetyltransferase